MKTLYPLFIKSEGMRCLVVGGGEVAARKISSLLQSGAQVMAVSTAFDEDVKMMARDNERLSLKQRCYEEADLDGTALVIAATDDAQVNEQISQHATKRGLLVNVVDKPELCNFFVPATVTRGSLHIAISTGGACPALAKKIRRTLEKQFGEHYERTLDCLATIRQELFEKYPDDIEKRSGALHRLLDSGIIEESANRSNEELLHEMRRWI